MFREIQNLIANGDIEEDELTSAAAYLLRKQFIFRSHSGDQGHYKIIDRYFLQFENAFSFFGAELLRDTDAAYIGFIPKKVLSTLKLTETACLLTLRLIYDQEKLSGISDTHDGSVVIAGERFVSEYVRNTGRSELTNKQAFREAMKPLRQKSIIRLGEKSHDSDIEDIIIYPSIEAVIDKHYAANLILALENEQPVDMEEEDLLHEAN
jgi:hypothetical protein